MELTIEQVSKRYGKKNVVNQVTLTLKPGITALLGPNGSGKTTLIRMLVGLLPPTQGHIFMDGIAIEKEKETYLSHLGYMPQSFGMYPNFKVSEFLSYMAALKGLKKSYSKERIAYLLKEFHLQDQKQKKIKTLSGGMKRRLGLAVCLLNDPDLIILDEPTAGLDPKERMHFKNLLASISQEKIILISTHIVSDVESLASRLIFLKKGTVLVYAHPEELLTSLAGHVSLECISYEEEQAFKKIHFVVEEQQKEGHFLLRTIHENTVENSVPPNLNDLYLSYFKEEEEW